MVASLRYLNPEIHCRKTLPSSALKVVTENTNLRVIMIRKLSRESVHWILLPMQTPLSSSGWCQ
jgi:hypothetical protein